MAWAMDGRLSSSSLQGDCGRLRMLSKPVIVMPLLLSTKGLCAVASLLTTCFPLSPTWTSVPLLMPSVSVSLGCPNRIPQTGALNNRNFFSPSSGDYKSQSKGWQGWFLVRTLFPACRRPPSCVSLRGCSTAVPSSSCKDTSPVGSECIRRPSLNSVASLKALFLNPVMSRVRTSTCGCWGIQGSSVPLGAGRFHSVHFRVLSSLQGSYQQHRLHLADKEMK